jgi:hypothetical protein
MRIQKSKAGDIGNPCDLIAREYTPNGSPLRTYVPVGAAGRSQPTVAAHAAGTASATTRGHDIQFLNTTIHYHRNETQY